MSEDFCNTKIYHIIHIDRLESILSDGFLFCDAIIHERNNSGTTIGISKIKERRLSKKLSSLPDLSVGQCVPFYFCPRSVMLYVIQCQNNPDLSYKNGQDDIIHLVFDMHTVIDWACKNNYKTCYTTSNAGSNYFQDYSDFSDIHNKVDWKAVDAEKWSGVGINPEIKENKQAEFLIENKLSIELLESIGVYNLQNYQKVNKIFNNCSFSPRISIQPSWYY
ncbi:MAG: DUF4433 domain-containing protein [Candidatus Gastranaerophilaceae bacterium]